MSIIILAAETTEQDEKKNGDWYVLASARLYLSPLLRCSPKG